MQFIWQRVSQTYAPFDVDVTTQDPGVDAIDGAATTVPLPAIVVPRPVEARLGFPAQSR